MKIIQIGSFPLNSAQIKGGVEASVYGLALEQNKNHKVIVLDYPRQEISNDKTETIDGIIVRRFINTRKSNTAALLRIPKYSDIIQNEKPEICHLHTSSLFAFAIYIYLKINKIPTIITIHGLAHIEKQNTWRKNRNIKNLGKYLFQSFIEFLLLSITKQIIVDTEYVSEAIKTYKKQGKIFKVPDCHVIPQGISSHFFVLKDRSIKNRILSVGSISQRKGHLQLIEALDIVIQKNPDIKVDIVGVLSEKHYYNSLIELIEAKKLHKQIYIHPNLSFEKVLSMYEEAEIFVLHSEEESQGIVFCEAMAAGKPIVATNVGGVPYIIKNGRNGFLSNFGDIANFASSIFKMLENETVRSEIAIKNKSESLIYSWDIIESRILNLYNSILKT